MDKNLQGRKNRRNGRLFENKVFEDLFKKGWVVSRFSLNIENNKIIKSKYSKFNHFTGFPDFICYIQAEPLEPCNCGLHPPSIAFNLSNGRNDTPYEFAFGDNQDKPANTPFWIIFIECKSNGYLSKEEKEKAKWYLENNYCSKFLIASRGDKHGTIKYKEFEK